MSNTRYNNDHGRIEKKNAISTFAGRYALDTPGPGETMPFNADPHIRIQGWGANFKNNMVEGIVIRDENCYFSAKLMNLEYDSKK